MLKINNSTTKLPVDLSSAQRKISKRAILVSSIVIILAFGFLFAVCTKLTSFGNNYDQNSEDEMTSNLRQLFPNMDRSVNNKKTNDNSLAIVKRMLQETNQCLDTCVNQLNLFESNIQILENFISTRTDQLYTLVLNGEALTEIRESLDQYDVCLGENKICDDIKPYTSIHQRKTMKCVEEWVSAQLDTFTFLDQLNRLEHDMKMQRSFISAYSSRSPSKALRFSVLLAKNEVQLCEVATKFKESVIRLTESISAVKDAITTESKVNEENNQTKVDILSLTDPELFKLIEYYDTICS